MLKGYHKKIMTAIKWREHTNISNWSPEEVALDIDMFVKEGVILPASVCQALVQRKLDSAEVSHQWETFIEHASPFPRGDAPLKFDPENPKLSQLPRHEAWKLRCFVLCMLDNCIGPLIFQASEGLGMLQTVVCAAKDFFFFRG